MANVTLETKVSQPAPFAYTIPGAQEIQIVTARASFDGTAAVGSWIPCLRILAPDGQELGAYTYSAALAAGASADLTWFPRGGVSSGGGGSGIEFDKDNKGGYFDVTINAADPDGLSGKLITTADGDFLLGWDASASGSAGASGDVIVGVGYSGNRAIRFRQNSDSPSVYTETYIDDDAIDVSGSNSREVRGLAFLTDTLDSYNPAAFPDQLVILLGDTTALTVYNLANGALFKVDPDGALHGKTGQALTFDL